MSDRITRDDLGHALVAHEACLRRYGMIAPSDRLALAIGSKTYGNAYRVNVLHADSSAHYEHPVLSSSGFLGMTAREAYERLTDCTWGIYRTAETLDRYPRHEHSDAHSKVMASLERSV